MRAILGSVAAVLLARLLLLTGMRVPGVRAAVAILPAGALVGVLAWSSSDLQLPSLLLPVEAVEALPVLVRDTYVDFAPVALPVLVGSWAVVAGIRIVVRLRAIARATRRAIAESRRRVHDPRVERLAASVAGRMRIEAPTVAVVDACPGGALVVGIRQPLVLIDTTLVAEMDDAELEGVLAHELAHVRRRDNLVAVCLGLVRDLFFFVPGAGWALRQLHGEREFAADQSAIRVTRRPGALASGLLKVIGEVPQTACCSALVSRGTVVSRVKVLVDDRPPPSQVRTGAELLVTAVALSAAIGVAVQGPSTAAARGPAAVGVMWSPNETATEAGIPAGEAQAFAVYRNTRFDGSSSRNDGVAGRLVLDDDPDEVSRARLSACGVGDAGCRDEAPTGHGLPLSPRPTAKVANEALIDSWRATAVMSTAEGLSLLVFHRVE